MILHHTGLWAVVIKRDNGGEFFAHHNNPPCGLWVKHDDAHAFKKEMVKAGLLKKHMRVVKVNVTIEEILKRTP